MKIMQSKLTFSKPNWNWIKSHLLAKFHNTNKSKRLAQQLFRNINDYTRNKKADKNNTIVIFNTFLYEGWFKTSKQYSL